MEPIQSQFEPVKRRPASEVGPPTRHSLSLATVVTAAELTSKLKVAKQARKKPPPGLPPGLSEHGPDLASIENDKVLLTADEGELSD